MSPPATRGMSGDAWALRCSNDAGPGTRSRNLDRRGTFSPGGVDLIRRARKQDRGDAALHTEADEARNRDGWRQKRAPASIAARAWAKVLTSPAYRGGRPAQSRDRQYEDTHIGNGLARWCPRRRPTNSRSTGRNSGRPGGRTATTPLAAISNGSFGCASPWSPR